MSEFHIRCGGGDGARELIDRYASGETCGAMCEELRRHLEACRPCSELLAQTLRLRALVRRAVRRETAPESLKRAIREMIRGG